MPAYTISVGRPSKWGNPYRPQLRTLHGVEFWISSPPEQALSLVARHRTEEGAVLECVERFRREVQRPGWDEKLAELRGYNLSCWCRLEDPCHADVLLEVANA